MRGLVTRLLTLLLLALAAGPGFGLMGLAARAQGAAPQGAAPQGTARVALVVGNDAYRIGPRRTAANDAGLVAETLAVAGFTVIGARDLDGDGLRRAVGEFLGKAAAAGPDGAAVVYLAGHALQIEGDNYFLPVDAVPAPAAEVPITSLRLSDLTHALAGLRLRARIVVIDGAYADAAAPGPYDAGLALVDAEPGLLTAFNAMPGTTAADPSGAYGLYGETLSRLIKEGGVPVDQIFAQLRVAVNTASHGAVLPWNTGTVGGAFVFFERAAEAPALGSAEMPFASLDSRPLKDFSPDQAYDVAIARDTIPVYQDYLAVFPNDPLAARIRIIMARRREALFWRDALRQASPGAFWTYLKRYPKGPHTTEAQRRLARLAAAGAPPAGFAPLDFDVPPPSQAETAVFDNPRRETADLPPPPPPPLFLLPPPQGPRPAPPPPPAAFGLLPIPLAVALPLVRHVVKPGIVVPPQGLKAAYPAPKPPGGAPAPKPPGAAPAPNGTMPQATPIVPLPVPKPTGAALPVPKPTGVGKPQAQDGAATPPVEPHGLPKPPPRVMAPNPPVVAPPPQAAQPMIRPLPAEPRPEPLPHRAPPPPAPAVPQPQPMQPVPGPAIPHAKPPQPLRGHLSPGRPAVVPTVAPPLPHAHPPAPHVASRPAPSVPHPQPAQQIHRVAAVPQGPHPHPACGHPGAPPCRP